MNYHIEFDLDFKRNLYPGRLIAIEGLDGAGKTTQAHLLVERLEKKGHKAVFTKEPTSLPTGEFIRKVLSGEMKVPEVAFQYLFSADRAVHQEKIIDYLKKGFVVVTDRYFWSSVAYGADPDLIGGARLQGEAADKRGTGKSQMDLEMVAFSILSFYHQFLAPDITFYLDVDVETALSRIEKKGKEKEFYEQKEKLIKVKKGYDFLLEKFGREFVVVDGEKEMGEVSGEILDKSLKQPK